MIAIRNFSDRLRLPRRLYNRSWPWSQSRTALFLINNFSNCGRNLYSFWDIGRANDNIDWNYLRMYFKVIKSGTNRKLVCDFLLLVYSNFCSITHSLREISCDLEISSLSSTVVQQCRHYRAALWLAISVSVETVDVSYTTSEILEVWMTT